MYNAKEKIFWFAIVSRITVIILQCIFNLLCPDHKADAFISPSDPRETISVIDKLITILFGGFTRWDAQYFLHISKYGYTYEGNLAFYPLYPMAIRFSSLILQNIFFCINNSSASILSGVLLNFFFFVKASLILYDLTLAVTKKPKLSYRSAILFCINPASIFFSAIYSESLFAYLTFYVMLTSLSNSPSVFLPLSLSTITRSNGLTNFGFPLFIWLKNFLSVILPNFTSEIKHHVSSITFCSSLHHICISLLQILVTLVFSLIPLVLLQFYNYTKFCTNKLNETSLPLHVIHHAIEKKLIIPGSGQHPPWCNYKIPISYSYVQMKYWNVGFLRYYQLKQIPNFILALPILFIMIKCIFEFFQEHRNKRLLSFIIEKDDRFPVKKYSLSMFPFVIHGLFLSFFSIFFVHIQVSTRLIASASPLPYWFCALVLSKGDKEKDDFAELHYEDQENLSSKWKVFFMTQKKLSKEEKFTLSYFVGYFILGCFMYSNFLPWT